MGLSRRNHNMSHRLKQSESSRESLTDSNAKLSTKLLATEKEITTAVATIEHLKLQLNASRTSWANTCVEASASVPTLIQLKEKNVFTAPVREMVHNLQANGVPLEKVPLVIADVSQGLGIDVKDSIDKHSVSYIAQEGGIAADMQIAYEISKTSSKYLSFIYTL